MAGFHHEALLYAGGRGFVDGCMSFIERALEAAEPILVMVTADKVDLLRAQLDGSAAHVTFADMGEVGRNPARIIPAWREFADLHTAEGRTLWGIGEPIWADRSPAELVECQRHESLLNLAFADAPAFRLLCPYDIDALDEIVIDEAQRSHPCIVEDGRERPSDLCRDLASVAAPFAEPLPEPSETPRELAFDRDALPELRRFVARQAVAAGIGARRAADLMLAANEVATNSVRHAGGHGLLRVWREPDALVCEILDGGRIDEPLAGRRRPTKGGAGGHGLWMVNQLCELAQVRSFPTGNVVRLHMRRD